MVSLKLVTSVQHVVYKISCLEKYTTGVNVSQNVIQEYSVSIIVRAMLFFLFSC